MPTYEYECTKCGHRFEIFQKMTDPKLEDCPKCQGRVERLIGPGAGIVFKGSGFYQTDYRSESYKERAKAEKTGTEGSPAETGSTKGEAQSGRTGGGEKAGKGAPPARDATDKRGSKRARGKRTARPGGQRSSSDSDS